MRTGRPHDRPGRPQIDDSEPTKRITISISKSSYDWLKEVAECEHASLSDAIRSMMNYYRLSEFGNK